MNTTKKTKALFYAKFYYKHQYPKIILIEGAKTIRQAREKLKGLIPQGKRKCPDRISIQKYLIEHHITERIISAEGM